MKRKRHGSEEIVRKLREAEQMEAAGQTPAQVCQKLEIRPTTLARWRNQFRGMGDHEIKSSSRRKSASAWRRAGWARCTWSRGARGRTG